MTPARPSRGGVQLAAVASVLVPLLLFVWLATAGTWDVLRRERLGDFHDVQARSFLEGRIDVPAEAVHIEGIVVNGRTYMYFGPVPALLRMPVFALTDRYDGRLSVISMSIAFAVTLLAARSMGRRVSGSSVVAAALPALTGTSVLLFLAGRAFVYHEAIAWGVALSVATCDQLIALRHRFSGARLAAASALASAAFLSRASVGLGAVIALGLVCLGCGVVSRREHNVRQIVALAAAAVLPLVLYSAVNYAKFESAYRLPLDKQVFSGIDAKRQAALRANGGSLFGLGFVPTTLLQYSRPDALGLTRTFPWVSFPEPATVVGDAVFDTVDVAASVPATMPALLLLSGVGAVSLVRKRDLTVGLPALGAATGSATALTIGFIAHRYLGDVLPLLVLLAATGLSAVVTVRDAVWRRIGAAAVVVLAVVSLWVNGGLTLQYQRAFAPNVDPDLRESLLRMQHELPGGPLRLAGRGDELPETSNRGDLFAVGECDGLYWSDGTTWHAVERTKVTGHLVGSLAAPTEAIVVARVGNASLVAERVDETRGRLIWVAADGERFTSRAARASGEEWQLDVVIDRRLGLATASIDGALALDLFYLAIPRDAPQFTSAVDERRVPPPALCPDIADR